MFGEKPLTLMLILLAVNSNGILSDKCEYDRRKIAVCRGVDTLEEFLEGVKEAVDKAEVKIDDIKELAIQNSNVNYLAPAMFEGMEHVSIFKISSCNITDIPSDTFKKLPSLEELKIGFSSVGSISGEAFRGLGQLKELYIIDTNISTLPEGLFDDLISLEKLYMLNNKINEISFGAFENLKHLTELWLSGNDIEDIHATPLSSVWWSDGDNLKSLDKHIFKGLDQSTKLHLYVNALSSLPSEIGHNNMTFI